MQENPSGKLNINRQFEHREVCAKQNQFVCGLSVLPSTLSPNGFTWTPSTTPADFSVNSRLADLLWYVDSSALGFPVFAVKTENGIL